MSNSNSGGQQSLRGYQYQLIGACALLTETFRRRLRESSTPEKALDRLRQVTGLPERGNDDLVVREWDSPSEQHSLVVQFKFSAVRSATIKPVELKTILASLCSTSETERLDGATVVSQVLATNRPLSRESEQLYAHAQDPHSAIPDRVRSKLKPHENSQLAKLHLLHLDDLVPLETLEGFGRLYGRLEQEVRQGALAMIAVAMAHSARGAPIRIEDIAEAFTTKRRARLLVPDLVAPVTRENARRERDLALEGAPLFRRHVVDQLMQMCRERALVFVGGDGGCGKSVVLRDWAHRMAFSTNGQGTPDHRAMCWVTSAKACPDPLPATVFWCLGDGAFSGCQNLCDCGRPEDYFTTVARFVAASDALGAPDARRERPVLFLGLDGEDEFASPQREAMAHQMIEWFWEEDQRRLDPAVQEETGRCPRATLVVTSRGPASVRAKALLAERIREDEPAVLDVLEFSDDELSQAAEAASRISPPSLTPAQAKCFQGSSLGLDRVSLVSLREPTSLEPELTTNSSPTTVPRELLHALRHPVMWAAFLKLEPAQQDNLLGGRPLDDLADAFVATLVAKARMRNESLKHFDVYAATSGFVVWHGNLVETLVSVAAATRPHHHIGHFPKTLWAAEGKDAVDAPHGVAARLFHEAWSYAMIIVHDRPGHWSWRHGFVAAYLASLAGPSSIENTNEE